jgi:AmpD protein
MKIDIHTGLLDEAVYIESPNRDQRPADCRPELIVIHCISLPPGQYGEPWIEKFFCNELPPGEHPYFKEIWQQKVSAHLLIRRDGQIIQFVPFQERAWHAGDSAYCGRTACNDFSIGIELEGIDDGSYEVTQYQRLADVVKCLCKAYPELSDDRVTGHSDIAPGRKKDPGPGFEWKQFRGILRDPK